MGQGPEIKPGKAPGPVVTEERATLPELYGTEPGFKPMTQQDFLNRANCKVGHTTVTAEVFPKNA